MACCVIIGYSADDEPIREIRAFMPKTKKERNIQKRNQLFQKSAPIDLSEWFVYLVDGEKWYYKAAQDIIFLRTHHKEVKFLGIGRPNLPVQRQPNEPLKSVYKSYGKCCYCDIVMTEPGRLPTSCTKEHVIPKHKGGKITKSCCYACNQEKGGLMLHSYIQMLCLLQADEKPNTDSYKLLQTKIINANEIAKSLTV